MYYNNTKYGADVPDQMRTRTKMVAVFYNILIDLAGISACILFKENQQQVGSSGSNHRSSSRHGDGGSAGPKELQTEPNVGHLTRHKPVCGNCVVALRATASPPLVVPSPQWASASSALHLLLVAAVLPPHVLAALWTSSTLTEWGDGGMASCNRDSLNIAIFMKLIFINEYVCSFNNFQ